ncbi:MAG TPA: hypothetical protein VMN04_13380 [Thermoanaerobaculia bacterium]|nr:hypothetical protein [Thermoanaerobaculia bacterium]
MPQSAKYPLLAALGACLIAVVGCSKEPGTVERKTDTTTQTSAGEVKTTSESTSAGNALEAKSDTKTITGNGTVTTASETVIGTVTKYEPGKKIEVMTAEKKTRGFDLDDKSTIVSIDSSVAVGSRVKVTEQTGGDKMSHVTVKLES